MVMSTDSCIMVYEVISSVSLCYNSNGPIIFFNFYWDESTLTLPERYACLALGSKDFHPLSFKFAVLDISPTLEWFN